MGILIHWYTGRSQHGLSASLGVDRKTAHKYLTPAVAAGLMPGGPPVGEQGWRRLVCGWFPELADARLRQVSWPVIEPHRDCIAVRLTAGVTAAAIHRRLVGEHGVDAGVASLRRWVRANLPGDARRGAVTVLRDTPLPGQEAQIGYGQLGMWLDPRTGRRRTVWAFVMVLVHSRHLFVRPALGMDQAEWTAAHAGAFAFCGGVPARLVPGNLKTGVGKPGRYDPKISRSDAELAAYYAVLVDPARAFRPEGKARVERPMPYMRDSFWRGREFTSLEDMRTAAVVWSSDVAGQRACRPLDGAAPAGVSAAVEAPALRPLPTAPFVLAHLSAAKAGPDIHAKVGATLYSLPWRYLVERAGARSTTSMVQFFCYGELVKTHPRKQRGKQTGLSGYPPEKIAFHLRTPAWCRRRAAEIRPVGEAVIGELLAGGALLRLRAAQGVPGVAGKHDPGRLEAACAKATAAGDPSCRTIKGILAAGTETASTAARPAGDAGAPAHRHGPAQLFADVIPLPTATGPGATGPATTTPAPGTATPLTSTATPLTSTQDAS